MKKTNIFIGIVIFAVLVTVPFWSVVFLQLAALLLKSASTPRLSTSCPAMTTNV